MMRAATLILLLAGSLLGASRIAGAQVVDEEVETIYVDQADVLADDDNPGTDASPLRTLSRAISLASEANALSTPVRIIVGPGTYRESLQVSADERTTSAPLTIEGRGEGVIVSGSDVWDGWTGADDGIYSHPWPYDWGLAPLPEDWPDSIRPYLDANPVIRRQEMVFVDGTPLLQVMSQSELEADEHRFFVSEETDQLFINLPADADITRSHVEVATRPTLLSIGSRQNVSLRNVTFQHAANPVGSIAAVFVGSSRDVRLIDCEFVWNNGIGLGLFEDEAITVRRIAANHNGVGGVTGFQIRDLEVSDSEASFNGWRASRGWDIDNHGAVLDPNFIDFAAGQKFFGLRDTTFRDFRAIENLTGGLWLDYDNSDVTLDGLILRGNLTHGLFLDATQGPISLHGSQICQNETGILVANASNIHVVDNVVSMNVLGQLFIAGAEERAVIMHDTGEEISVRTHDWVMYGNHFSVDDGSVALGTHLDQNTWFGFIQTLDSQDNRYSSALSKEIFQLPGGRNVSLGQWRAETGKDDGSTFSIERPACPPPVRSAGTVSDRGTLLTFWLWVAAALGSLALIALGIVRLRRW